MREPLSLPLHSLSRDGGDDGVMPAPAAASELDRLQLDAGDAGGDVQPGLALHADRLQRVGIRRPADQKVAAKTDADRDESANSAITAGEFAAPDPPPFGRVHRPGQPGLVGESRDRRRSGERLRCRVRDGGLRSGTRIRGWSPSRRREPTFWPPWHCKMPRLRRQCIGTCDRRHQRSHGNRDCRNPHNLISKMIGKRTDKKKAPCSKQGTFSKSRRQKIRRETAK